MALDFDQPIKLRSADLDDDAQGLMIALSAQLDEVVSEVLLLRAIVDHDIHFDTERALRRLKARCHEVAEAAGRATDTREALARALRTTGRL